jgi:hypothetical protein
MSNNQKAVKTRPIVKTPFSLRYCVTAGIYDNGQIEGVSGGTIGGEG